MPRAHFLGIHAAARQQDERRDNAVHHRLDVVRRLRGAIANQIAVTESQGRVGISASPLDMFAFCSYIPDMFRPSEGRLQRGLRGSGGGGRLGWTSRIHPGGRPKSPSGRPEAKGPAVPGASSAEAERASGCSERG